MKDYLVRGIDEKHHCRFMACTTTNLTNVAREHHELWPCASAALGRMMSAVLMMSANNKNGERMTVTINGGGPIGTLLATTNSDGKIKAFVSNPQVHYTYNDTGKLAVGLCVGNNGTLQVIRDMGLKEPITSSVALQTGEIGDDFSYYFTVSEQVNTAVALGVLVNPDTVVVQSGGYMVQMLPDATDEDITYLEEKITSLPPVTTLLEEGHTAEDIIHLISDDARILETQDLYFECDCSKEKFVEALKTIPKSQLTEMIEEDHGAEITCQFCNTKYQFTEEELKKIRDE